MRRTGRLQRFHRIGVRGHGFRVEKEAPGFIERGAAVAEAEFRAACRRCGEAVIRV